MKPNPYESQRYLNEYLLLHYGRLRHWCPLAFVRAPLFRFHERLRRECLAPVRAGGATRGLDLGCGVGRFTFELGRVVDRALGIDNSKQFIRAAREMATRRRCRVRLQQSGKEYTSRRLALPPGLRADAVEFRVGDAMDLNAFPTAGFDVVAAINLICRLPRPKAFLGGLERLVVPGGQLLLASPFSWLEEHTTAREWLTSSQVVRILQPHFRLMRRRELPFILREHRRKYQLVLSEVLTFLRRG